MMISNDYYAPISPELLHSLSFRNDDPKHSPEKSDMFSLGITMLCAATNEHFSSFYNFRQFEIRFELILARLNELIARGYSKLLVGTISNLLHKDT